MICCRGPILTWRLPSESSGRYVTTSAPRGDAAVIAATQRFDGVDLADPGFGLRVPADELTRRSTRSIRPYASALEEAIRRTRQVTEATRPHDVSVEVVPGSRVTERWVPVSRVGLYVPGGRVAYPSSVVMNVVPAQVAGSARWRSRRRRSARPGCRTTRCSPPARCSASTRSMRSAGPRPSRCSPTAPRRCPRVDVITGPGNVYVAAAKRLVRGVVGIDAEAGATEIAILADDTADPVHLAADLISQAEHDPLAACLLVSDSETLLEQVEAEVVAPGRGRQAPRAHRRRADRAERDGAGRRHRAGHRGGRRLGRRAPRDRHGDADAVAARVRHAGAIFVGPHAPVTLGDYLAGSNHVLPTGGTARHTSGLSVLLVPAPATRRDGDGRRAGRLGSGRYALGAAEDLHAHVEAVRVRVDP